MTHRVHIVIFIFFHALIVEMSKGLSVIAEFHLNKTNIYVANLFI